MKRHDYHFGLIGELKIELPACGCGFIFIRAGLALMLFICCCQICFKCRDCELGVVRCSL